MFSKKINKMHLLSEIWNKPPHIVKLWFTLLMLRDEKGYISENIDQIERLSCLEQNIFDDALHFLLNNKPESDGNNYLSEVGNKYRITCLDKSEQRRIDLMPKWKEKTKDGYLAYVNMTKKAFNEIVHDYSFMLDLKDFYPNNDIIKSIQACFVNYWGSETAWLKKRKQKIKNINWRETIKNTIKFHLVKRDTSIEDYEKNYLIEKIKQQSMIVDNAI